VTRVAADGRDDLLIVPSAVADDPDGARLVAFVQRAERRRDAAERARLLYVAATRARERLHLVWQLAPDKATPPANAMLSYLWSALELDREPEPAPATAAPTAEPSGVATLDARLRRLADLAASHGDAPPEPTPAPSRPEFVWAGHAAVHVGTVVHRYLQRIAEQGLAVWTAEAVAALADAFSSELMLLGVDPTELEPATARVIEALSRVLANPLGRWVLGPHDDARSELRLALRRGDTLEHLRLDRTFVDSGQRWIIDYKTSTHEGGDVGAFLDSEVERYAPQLERYARAMTTIDGRSVRVGLYFPLLGELRDWSVPTASP
jgi:ATP-dependent helicase/nuclease subunit A